MKDLLPGWRKAAVPSMGRGTRIPDMVRLLAVLAARQRGLPTVQAMRKGGVPVVGQAPADRMVRLFAEHGAGHGQGSGTGRLAGAGAFNRGTAHYLAGKGQGEDGIYRGA